MSLNIKIIKNSAHVVLHEFSEKDEYIILLDGKVIYWRPALQSLNFHYTTISDLLTIVESIKSKKYRSEKIKLDLLEHWDKVHQLMREFTIEQVLSQPIDNSQLYSAC